MIGKPEEGQGLSKLSETPSSSEFLDNSDVESYGYFEVPTMKYESRSVLSAFDQARYPNQSRLFSQ